MIDPLDYDRSIMELQLKKQKLEEEIADIDNVLKWMNEQKQELLNTTDDLTSEIFKIYSERIRNLSKLSEIRASAAINILYIRKKITV